MCAIFLRDFNQIGICREMFIKIPQYEVSRKSVHWEPRDTYRQTDGRGEAIRCLQRLCEHVQSVIVYRSGKD